MWHAGTADSVPYQPSSLRILQSETRRRMTRGAPSTQEAPRRCAVTADPAQPKVTPQVSCTRTICTKEKGREIGGEGDGEGGR